MTKYYKVVAFAKNGAKKEFPSTDGGRYTGASPMIAVKKAGKVAARAFGAGKYTFSLYETTRDSRNNTNEYSVKVTKKARAGKALKVENVKNGDKKNVKNGVLKITPSRYSVEVL